MNIDFMFPNYPKETIQLDDAIIPEIVEKVFKIHLSNKVGKPTIDKYCRFVNQLPNACVKEQICNQSFDFFKLRDINILKKLCNELKNGKLYQYDITNKNGDTHACINSKYLPFLDSQSKLKDIATKMYDDYIADLQDYSDQSFEDFQEQHESVEIFYTMTDNKPFFITKSKESNSIATILKEQKADNPKYLSKQSFIDLVIHGKFQNNTLKTYSYGVFNNILDKYIEKIMPQNNQTSETNLKHNNISRTKQPLNQILYGPPGTGKTYNTIDRALNILGFNNPQEDSQLDYKKIRSELEKLKSEKKLDINIDESNDRICAKTLFDHYHNEGQIEFVTFHQNYGYEEFIEGIKPILDDDSDVIKYTNKPGVFKSICDKARENIEKSKKTQKEIQQDMILDEELDSFLSELINTQDTIKTLNGTSFVLENARNNKIKISIPECNYNEETLKYEILLDVIKQKDKVSKVRDVDQIIGYHTRQSSFYYALTILFDQKRNKIKTPIKKVDSTKQRPYILIIDEINRGNVSKIFGELITLIEPSKRIGADEELQAMLPYSQRPFGVPDNLYIIGTMNTADRSITSLDTALRRRFEFVEMMPDATKLRGVNIQGVGLEKLLQAINERIEFLYDREKTIGHAYLLEVKNLDDLKEAFQNKIIPLLQEYFYNDYEAIQAVLNDNGMIRPKDNKSGKQDFLAMGKFKAFVNDRGLDEKKVFEITPKDAVDKDNRKVWDNPSTYTKIYDVYRDNKTQPNDNELDTLSEPSDN